MGLRNRLYPPYIVFMGILLFFTVYAFYLDSPREIWEGYLRIVISPSNLITDYIAVGGIGATLINSALTGMFALLVMVLLGKPPTGASIMSLWLAISFACFGKNIFNMMPLFFGVWLCAKIRREPFKEYVVTALLSSTLAPVVSEVSFWNSQFGTVGTMLCGIGLGIFCGFIFPALAAYVIRAHDGYMLYNMGFAGGVISVFIVSIAQSLGIEFEPVLYWDIEHSKHMTVLISVVSIYLMIIGIVGTGWRELAYRMKSILAYSGKSPSDYYNEFGDAVYFNMGITGIIYLAAALALGADINGPSSGGIFTIIGFACFGKHLRNTAPVFIGAIISSYVNMWDPTAPVNILAILFSTGLAPIAGSYGWHWGIVAGFLHVNFVHHAGYLNNGLNLYNNGFSAGFVAMLLVPLILMVKKIREQMR